MILTRYNQKQIQKDLAKKMVLLAGPRQVGKTTLARSILPNHHQYFNYDSTRDRKMLVKELWNQHVPLIVLDEVHKMPKWKQWLKGVWDTNDKHFSFLITGSARLEYVKKSGESLAGRYYLHRLHPLSIKEVECLETSEKALARLMKYSGFPEPFLTQDEVEAERWRRGHQDRMLREDLRDITNITQIKTMELLIELLSERVGSTISYSSLSQDLGIAPKTVKHWIDILESLYIVFKVMPYSKNLARAIRKEPKVYFYDLGCVADKSSCLENLVALHLLKRNHYLEDFFGKKMNLHFVRDKEKREVDFLTIVNSKPELLIEVKTSDTKLSSSLRYYQERLSPLKAIQLVKNLDRDHPISACEIRKMSTWLSLLEC